MSTEALHPPPFYCPACGQKHRADLSALQGSAGAVAKVTCSRCEVVMALQIGADGLPKCEMNEPLGGAMSQPDVKKPNLLLPIAAAVLAAAIVSFGVVSATKSDAPAAPSKDPAVAVLEQTVKELRAEIGALTSLVSQRATSADAANTAAAQQRSRAETTVATLGRTMGAIEGQQAKLSTTFLSLQRETKSLNGRIESNYTTLRKLDKRVKAVEAN